MSVDKPFKNRSISDITSGTTCEITHGSTVPSGLYQHVKPLLNCPHLVVPSFGAQVGTNLPLYQPASLYSPVDRVVHKGGRIVMALQQHTWVENGGNVRLFLPRLVISLSTCRIHWQLSYYKGHYTDNINYFRISEIPERK